MPAVFEEEDADVAPGVEEDFLLGVEEEVVVVVVAGRPPTGWLCCFPDGVTPTALFFLVFVGLASSLVDFFDGIFSRGLVVSFGGLGVGFVFGKSLTSGIVFCGSFAV